MFSNYDHSRHQQAIEHRDRMQRQVASERLLRRTRAALRLEAAVPAPQDGRTGPRGLGSLSASTLR